MKSLSFITLLLYMVSGVFTPVFAQGNDAKLATKARDMIGKKDRTTTKINTLQSNYAVFYCAKNAGVITQKESDKHKRLDLLSERDTKTSSVTRIPKGHIIGFLHRDRLLHVMISTGNGKAVGTQNKRGIGLGQDRVWEEISLQPLVFDGRKGTFKIKGKDVIIVHRTADKFILQPQPDKNGKTVVEDGNDPVSNPDPTTRNKWNNDKYNNHAEMDKYPWSVISGTSPSTEYEKHKHGFSELGNWKQYAAKANDMIRTMKKSNGSYKFSNPNLTAEIYDDVFIYDKVDRIVLKLDNQRKPATMFRVKNLGEYKSYVNESIHWYSKSNNPIAQIKKEFKKYGSDFNFARWSEYGYFAQQTLDNAVKKSKFKQNEFLLGRHNGYLVYYHKQDQIFIIGNRHEHEVVTMFKLKDGEDEFQRIVEEKYTINDPDKIDEQIHEYGVVDIGGGNEYESTDAPLGSGNRTRNEYESTDAPLGGGEPASTRQQPKKEESEYTGAAHLLVDYDPTTNYAGYMKYSTRSWGKVGDMPGTRACMLEYKKWKYSFLKKNGSPVSLKEYIAVAYNFIANTPENTHRKSLAVGGVALYNVKFNLLATYDESGKPTSLRKPENQLQAYNDLDGASSNGGNSGNSSSNSSASDSASASSSQYDVFYNNAKVRASESKVSAKYAEMKKAIPNLDTEDFLVIYHYTDANYQYINGALWKNERLDDYLYAFKVLLNGALDKLPNRRGKSYRGTRLPQSTIQKYEDAYNSGNTVTETAFLSTSVDEEVAKYYAAIGGRDEDKAVLYIIKGKKGKDVDLISKFGSTFDGEEGEVLFKSGSTFKVTDIEKSPNKGNGNTPLILITLEEM